MEKQPEIKKQLPPDAPGGDNSTLVTEITPSKTSVSVVDDDDEEEDEEELKRRLNRTARLYFNVKRYTQLEDRTSPSRFGSAGGVGEEEVWGAEQGGEGRDAAAGTEGAGTGEDDLLSFHDILRKKRDEKIAKFISLGTHPPPLCIFFILMLCPPSLTPPPAEDYVAIGMKEETDQRSWQPPDLFTANPSVSMSGADHPDKQSEHTSRITSRVPYLHLLAHSLTHPRLLPQQSHR
jgi:hypothetical protein